MISSIFRISSIVALLALAAYYFLNLESFISLDKELVSALNDEKRKGIYRCAGCDAPLFRSENKYNSGSGWPSFDQPLSEKAIFYAVDYEIGVARTEERCANCGSHLGHVFEDGPRETTGLRHCINGVALKFVPDEN